MDSRTGDARDVDHHRARARAVDARSPRRDAISRGVARARGGRAKTDAKA